MSLEQLGPYRLHERLGRGGMGTVYRATDERSGEVVAVKVLNVTLAHEEGFRQRFNAEIETLKKLRHPHIVQMYGYGEHDGYVYYGMELVPGKNMEQALAAGERFPWRQVIQIGAQMAKALKHAHDRGVIHRDIKPANLMLLASGDVKLTDFGIARLFGKDTGTNVGGVMGTAQYMAPEQVEGKHVTPSCDLYSLGGVLYTLLANRPPFVAKTLPQMLHLQRFGVPESIRLYNAECPKELDQLILTLLAKEPKDRIPAANVVGRQLQSMYHGLDATADRLAVGDEFTLASDSLPAEAAPNHLVETRIAPATGGLPTVDGTLMEGPVANRLDPTAILVGPSPPAVPRDRTEPGSAEPTGPVLSPTDAWVAPAPPPKRIFTSLEEEERARQAAEEPEWLTLLKSPQAWLLALALAGILSWSRYMLSPATAEQLLNRIEVSQQKDPQYGLLAREDDVVEFLKRHPDHPRREEALAWQQELELQKLARRTTRKLTLGEVDSPQPAAAEAYQSAMRYLRTDPGEAAARLRSLVVLYESSASEFAVDQPFVALAKRQLERLPIAPRTAQQNLLRQLSVRLAEANRVAATEPERARVIWQAIVQLYGNDAHCSALVAEAERGLQGLSLALPATPSTTSTSPPAPVTASQAP